MPRAKPPCSDPAGELSDRRLVGTRSAIGIRQKRSQMQGVGDPLFDERLVAQPERCLTIIGHMYASPGSSTGCR